MHQPEPQGAGPLQHGPAGQRLRTTTPAPRPALLALLRSWCAAHGRPWLRSLWPPSEPLDHSGLRRLPLPNTVAWMSIEAAAFSLGEAGTAPSIARAVRDGEERAAIVAYLASTSEGS